MAQPTGTSAQYTVLARRFRPQTFDEVVGQEHIGQAIRNAITGGRVAHAYLFTGARGVGKTSTARIFAKALNCPNAVDGVPCNQCEVCRAIGTGNDVDVLEIDGASNRGIDDIRSLRANVNVKSMRSPYKVYIIDEVHMLTKEAFNALLKTLEEPPANVKFVFCTTEPNKVPDTILSRCQRFDFGTIEVDSIAGRLKQIAEAEGVQVEDEAIELVARRAGGSMRDSQSLFDQLLAFGQKQISVADVHQLLGTADDERLIALVDSVMDRRQADALRQLDEAMAEGIQLDSFLDQLIHYLRDLMVVAVGAAEVPLVGISGRSREQVQRQSQRWGLPRITAAMQILSETKMKMMRLSHGRVLVELALVRLSLLEDLDSVGELIAAVRDGKTFAAPVRVGRESPAAEVPRRAAGSAATDGEESRAKKKRDEEPDVVPDSEPTGVEVPSEVELTEESLDGVWSQVISASPDNLQKRLECVCGKAILGPNLLELSLGAGYSLDKDYLERLGGARLQEIFREVTGQPIELRFRMAEGDGPRKTIRRREEGERKRVTAVEGDEFVQAAVSIFGGTVVEVRTLGAAAAAVQHETDDPQHAVEDDDV